MFLKSLFVTHYLQTPPLGQQLTTDILFYVIERVSHSPFNFQMYLDSSVLLTYSLYLKSL